MPTITKNKKRLAWQGKTNPDKIGWRSMNDKRYDSMAWRRLTNQIKQAEPFCRQCKANGIVRLATVTDHIVAVRLGGEFWNEDNLQPLCDSCHNAKKT